MTCIDLKVFYIDGEILIFSGSDLINRQLSENPNFVDMSAQAPHPLVRLFCSKNLELVIISKGLPSVARTYLKSIT